MDTRLLVERFARAQAAHPWRFLIAVAAATAIGLVAAAGLGFDSRYEALLPKDSPEVRNVDDVRARTGGTRQIVIGIRGGDREKRLAFARKLAPGFARMAHVRYVDVEFPVEFFEDRGLLLMGTDELDDLVEAVGDAIAATKWFNNPMNPKLDEEAEKAEIDDKWERVDAIVSAQAGRMPIGKVLSSKDGVWTFMLVIPQIKFTDIKAGKDFMNGLEAVVAAAHPEREGLEVRFAGNLVTVQEQQKTMIRDMTVASILSFVLCIIVVAGFTRRWVAPLAVGLPLIAGVTWTLAFARLSVGHVNVITGFLVSVLFGLGIDFGIHLFLRYQQEMRFAGLDLREAMVKCVISTLKPAFTAGATTAGTFLAFTLAEFRGFSEFGIIAAVGVLLTYLAAFLVVPPLMIIWDAKRRILPPRIPLVDVQSAPPIPIWLAAAAVAAIAGLAAYGVFNARNIHFVNDFRKLRGGSEAAAFQEYVDRNIGMGSNPAVFLVDEVEQAAMLAGRARGLKDSGEAPRIGKVLAISDFLPGDTDAKMERVTRLEEMAADPKLDRATGDMAERVALARKLTAVEPWGVKDLPQAMQRRFVTLDGKQVLVMIWPVGSNDSDAECAEWERELGDIGRGLADAGIRYQMADETLVVAWVNKLVTGESPWLLTISSLVVVVLILIDFMSVWRTFILVLALAMGMLGFLGAIRATGQSLNLFNIIVLPSIIGIGIDNAVHILHRYRAEGPGSIPIVLRRTGIAAFLASLTTAIGFGTAVISHNVGLRTLGYLAMTGMATTFISAVVFFPCLITLLERAGVLGRRRRPL